jgi:hypothetical protein
MFNFTEKKYNIYIYILTILFLILSVVSILNFGTIDFFDLIFQALIPLQIITIFFGVKIKNYNSGKKTITKYYSFLLLLISGLISALFITSVINFGFGNNDVLLYQILTTILILSILIIIIPIHVKLLSKDV